MIYSDRGEAHWDKEQEKLQEKWRKEREERKNKKSLTYKCQMCEECFDNETSLQECITEHQKTIIYLKAQVKSYEEIFENAVYKSLKK